MNRIRAALRQYRAHRAFARARAAQRGCCGGNCTSADAVLRGQLGPVYIPRQRRNEESQ